MSGNLFESAVKGLSVYHEIDNTLDDDPLLLELSLKFDRLSFARRQFVARLPGIKPILPTLIIIERL